MLAEIKGLTHLNLLLLFQVLIANLNFFGTFYLYAGVSFAGLLWGLYQIPDNRGLSLAKVEEKLSAAANQKKKLELG
jgi:hypothetical protein